MELGGQGRAQEATEQFREAVRLMPDVVEARVNLGIALKQQGRSAEAVEQFREVLRRSPTNAVALKNVEELQ
jgi:Flp pilus assembly protein TadD